MASEIEEKIAQDNEFLDDTWNGFTSKMKYEILKHFMGDVLLEEYSELDRVENEIK